jgi:hypothetical protein
MSLRKRLLVVVLGLGAAWCGLRGWQMWSTAKAFAANDADEPIRPSERHVMAMRKLRFTWDPWVESGAPLVDRRAPYGSRSPADDLAPILGTRDPLAVARFHLEVGRAFAWALEHGELAPGRYPVTGLTNASMEAAIRASMHGSPEPRIADAVADFLPRLDPDGTFAFTDQHRELLRHLRVKWTDGLPLAGFLPMLSVNPKRPFGDMTAFDIDMASILGQPKPVGREFSPSLWRLYVEMWPALAVFAEHARVETSS